MRGSCGRCAWWVCWQQCAQGCKHCCLCMAFFTGCVCPLAPPSQRAGFIMPRTGDKIMITFLIGELKGVLKLVVGPRGGRRARKAGGAGRAGGRRRARAACAPMTDSVIHNASDYSPCAATIYWGIGDSQALADVSATAAVLFLWSTLTAFTSMASGAGGGDVQEATGRSPWSPSLACGSSPAHPRTRPIPCRPPLPPYAGLSPLHLPRRLFTGATPTPLHSRCRASCPA